MSVPVIRVWTVDHAETVNIDSLVAVAQGTKEVAVKTVSILLVL